MELGSRILVYSLWIMHFGNWIANLRVRIPELHQGPCNLDICICREQTPGANHPKSWTELIEADAT